MTPLLAAMLALLAQDAEPVGLARLRREAGEIAPLVSTELARAFLGATSDLPPVRPRTLSYDPASRSYLTDDDADALPPEAREALREIPVDEAFYYTTRYGSPLAYARPIELLGRAGLDGLAGRRVADFGCGGIGPMRLMALLGADAVGIDVDPMLAALYSGPDDLGPLGPGRVSLAIGRYPADDATRAAVGGGLDVFLSKNTLKRGYVHPDSGPASIDLGMSDAAFLGALHDAIRPGGLVLIYNLGPAPGPAGGAYLPMADIRCPFSRADWEAAGFRVEAIDQDDSPAARELGAALGWDEGPGAMDLEAGLFASYTLARKP